MASLPFSSPPFRPAVGPPPLTPSMQAPPPMPAPMPAGLSPFAPAPHRDEASFNARLFAVLNSLEQRNEKRPEASVPTYVKWGLPFLVVSQVATLALLAFNMNEMSALKSCQSSMENTVDRIEKDLLKKASFQDILVMAQELISGETPTNPDLQPLSDICTKIRNQSDNKKWIKIISNVIDSSQKNKALFQTIPWAVNALGLIPRFCVKVVSVCRLKNS
jgi:hypothetical protein